MRVNPRLAFVVLALTATLCFGVGCSESSIQHEPGVVRQRECLDCHEAERKSATNPPHDSLPTTCQDCHSEGRWVPAELGFGHPWPLDGAHARTLCASCHLGAPPLYAGTPTACVGCHRDDYDSSPFQGHETFQTTCEDCHSTEHWKPASSTAEHPFPLEGAHSGATCVSCHLGDPPAYAGTPTECVGCHRDDFDNNGVLGHTDFPLTCADCHGVDAWTPATGGIHPENAFPIESGPHEKYRDDCVSCHDAELGSPVGGENADCVGCHDGDHTRAKMDDKHREERDYPTGAAPPNFCLECHENGRE